MNSRGRPEGAKDPQRPGAKGRASPSAGPGRAPAQVAAFGPTRPRRRFDDDGWLLAARRVRSPNCDHRPPGTEVTLVVVHGISLPPGEFGGDAIERLFTNALEASAHPSFATVAELRVSAHFLIRRDGALLQFVPCHLRAWHAGASSWRGRDRCNDFSIGIELEGTDFRPYTARQYARLARLLASLRQAHPIADVVGHSDVAPGRKTDPGPAFDWARLARLAPWTRTRGRAPR